MGCDQLEQDAGLDLVASHVAEIIEDDQMVLVELLDGTCQW